MTKAEVSLPFSVIVNELAALVRLCDPVLAGTAPEAPAEEELRLPGGFRPGGARRGGEAGCLCATTGGAGALRRRSLGGGTARLGLGSPWPFA